MVTALPLYVDIDGTLTDLPTKGGNVIDDRITKVKRLIEAGQEVVIWSGGGTSYAKKFAQDHGLNGVVCIGKPDTVVDDNPTIRPSGRMAIRTPTEFFS
jgi:hypothetical protein